MKSKFTIGEISKLFNINTTTLRLKASTSV